MLKGCVNGLRAALVREGALPRLSGRSKGQHQDGCPGSIHQVSDVHVTVICEYQTFPEMPIHLRHFKVQYFQKF